MCVGWCYIAKHNAFDISELLSYEIWVYLVFIALPVLYLTAFFYLRYKVGNYYNSY